MNEWLSIAARMPDKEGKAASKKLPRSRVEPAIVSAHKSHYEGEVTRVVFMTQAGVCVGGGEGL